jgi:benzoate membrane transport protein
MTTAYAPSTSAPGWPRVFGGLNAQNVAAGLTAFLSYAFAASPIYLAGAERLGLTPEQTASSFFVIFASAALTTIPLAILYRQPLAMGFSLPALIYLTTLSSRYSVEQLAGAGVIAGVIILLLAVLGIGELIQRYTPVPVALGMFAGSAFGDTAAVFTSLQSEMLGVGGAIGGYVLARAWGKPWLPPVAGAAAIGFPMLILAGHIETVPVDWQLPGLVLVSPAFDFSSVVAISLPLVALVVAAGNAQSFAVLSDAGYKPPVRIVTAVVGITSVLHSMFGGPPASMQRQSLALMAGDEAGPRESRYVATLVASIGALLIAFCAASATSFVEAVPRDYVVAIGGLALLAIVFDALKKTITSKIPTAGFFAFLIASSDLTLLGLGGAFWAIIGGIAVAVILERPKLLDTLCEQDASLCLRAERQA